MSGIISTIIIIIINKLYSKSAINRLYSKRTVFLYLWKWNA